MEPLTLVLLVGGAVAAGWVDAVIGGGGLILIPLILASFPHLAPATALGTNKVAGVMGTSAAAVTMLRRIRPNPYVVGSYLPIALLAAGAGAGCASLLSAEVMRPVIIVLMLAVGVFVACRPSFGAQEAQRVVTPRRIVLAGIAVAVVGFYDGIFGPGTGMFLIMAFTVVFSQSFVESAVMAKLINVSTNLGALVVFAAGGHVWLTLGLALAVANMVGAYLGARTVLGGGARLVRYAVLTVVVVMSTYLIFQG
ncbi:TSUP family transporter [Corynebacterium tapiri]|uniref:Probable membrane transporter protein n=1 Tax=Corynebacterium tapiri TaxID=1448266 RepID=A0A5C4U3J7_9CORY|nr:TSUP family transporter [Corynebacterium tapiri]TNL96787.1 sulfite exporter TauE/SafE family protein [Corynebacterium tapiri]